MNSRWRYLLGFIFVLVVLLAGMAAGIVLDRQVLVAFAQPAPLSARASPDFNMITQAWKLIDQNYVDRSALQPVPMTYGAISGMVDALGDTGHSTFLSPQMVQEERNFAQGQFEGIGAQVEKSGDHVVIVAPLDNSPAQKAGIHPGDIILKVNGSDVSSLALDQVVQRILGPAGSSVTLTVQDPKTGQSRDVTVVRAHIILHNVTWQALPGTTIAHLRVAGFSQGVGADLKQALNEIRQQHMTGIILDLRNNPGGLLNECVTVTSQFLAGGSVLLEKNARGQVTPVPVEPGGLATQTPLVVVVNSGTASAAEIVAGAIQDARRGQLVGETTFGTGTVLNQFALPDGSALLLATEEWLTPAGRVIWHHGISPDVAVPLPTELIPLTPEAERGMTAAQLNASADQQLLRAVQLLTTSP